MKRTITQGLGAFDPRTWAQIRESVEGQDNLEFQGRDRRAIPVFFAQITAATQVGVTVSGVTTMRARWKYEWLQSVRKDATAAFPDSMYDTLVGGRTSADPTGGGAKRFAVNLFEVANTATVAMGIAVTNGTTIVSASLYVIKPIPIGTIVELRLMRDRGGNISPTFSAMNPIDGSCPAPDSNLIDGGTF